MTTYEKTYISFRAHIDSRGAPPFELGQIEEWANKYKQFAYQDIDDKTFDKIIGELKEQFTVTQSFGGTITDNFHDPWWEKFKSSDNDLHYSDRLKLLLMEDQNLPPAVVNRLDSVTDSIIDLAGDPNKQGLWNRRGMVIGHVQSGKTMNYSAVICKAADAGYRVIVLLAGMTNSLRRQTQDRINEAFIGKRVRENQQLREQKVGVGLLVSNPKIPLAGTFLESDFSAKVLRTTLGYEITNFKEPIIFVCKKNVSPLRNLLEYFNWTDPENKLDLPLLLIDDEADNASINTKIDKNEITAINLGIREILKKFGRSSYLGYTATPFANIFIDPEDNINFGSDDLFPANFIRTLEAPSNYMGAEKIFGNNAEFFERMIIPISDFEDILPLKHKNNHQVEELPGSLRLAVIHFILAKTIRVLRDDRNKHCTMMINVSRFNSVQTTIEGLVYELLQSFKNDIKVNAKSSRPSSSSVIHEFENEYFNQFCEKVDDDVPYPDWADVKAELFSGWDVQIKTVNTLGGILEYDAHKDDGLTVIAIGGLSLSRGLTLEGLCTTYILRNAAAYDTLMQMGRWFGYRPNYEDLCRLYLHEEAIDHYQATSEAINELRAEVEFMASENLTPTEFGLKVRRSPFALRITAANKMRSSTKLLVDIGFRGKTVEGHTIYLDDEINNDHLKITSEFLQNIGEPIKSDTTPVPKDTWLWEDVKANKIIQLLKNFKLPSHCEGLAPIDEHSLVVDFINTKIHELSNWNIHLNNVVEDDSIDESHDENYLSYEVFKGKKIVLRKRTGIFLGEKFYKINPERKVGTGDDAKAGLSESVYSAFKKAEDVSKIQNKQLKELSSFKPTLVIYYIKPKDKNDVALPFTDGLVSLVLHFPFEGNLNTEPKEYEANKIYEQLRLFSDNEDDEEARDILSQEG